MPATVQAANAGAVRIATPSVNVSPGDWDALIKGCVMWGLALLAFTCGAIAMLTTFGNKDRMADLLERYQQLSNLISQTENYNARVGALAVAVDRIEHVTVERIEYKEQTENASTTGTIANEIALNKLAKRVIDFSTDFQKAIETIDNRLDRADQKFTQMELRLNTAGESQIASAVRNNTKHDENIATQQAPATSPAKISVSNFRIVRITEGAAWLASPKGWIHIAIGDILPGGAKILAVGKNDSRSVVLTDQGPIMSAR